MIVCECINNSSKLQMMNFIERLFPWCCNIDSPPPILPKKSSTNDSSGREERNNTMVQAPSAITSISLQSLTKFQDSVNHLHRSRNNHKDHYEGDYFQGLRHGNGVMLYANGDFYKGKWVYDKKQGKGMHIYHDLNTQYEGDWKDNLEDGIGKLTENYSSSYYIGEFKNGHKHGKGQYFDFVKKKLFNQVYEDGQLKEQKEVVETIVHQQEFVTLNFDKERFNTHDLEAFQRENVPIQDLDLQFLLKYFGICKIISLSFVRKKLHDWTIKEVLDFLDMINLKAYKELFYRNKIKGKDLMTLKNQELKNDLKMNIGDRKRLLNYIGFLKDANQSQILSKNSQHRSIKSKNYQLRSAASMKSVLQNIRTTSIYKQSIQQEPSQMDIDSKEFLKIDEKELPDDQPHQEMKISTPDECKYGSVRCQVQNFTNNNEEMSSLEKIIEPRSQRSEKTEEKSVSSKRKNSRDIEQFGQHHVFNLTHHNLPETQGNNPPQRLSQKLIPVHFDPSAQNNQVSQSSSSSEDQVKKMRLQRKKTGIQKINLPLHSSEIRQLYDFLKEHRSLSFIIKEKDIKDIKLIGQGGFGKVYRGKYIGQQIAIKNYIKTGKHHHKQDFMKELQIISDLKHPNIVLYMGICITADKYTLITQYLQNGSLFDQLHKKRKRFTQQQQMSIAHDIVKGMVYLHNMKKILHRDLKSSNVLMGENWQVKLCDFGLSGQMKKSKKNKARIGTYQWMAPQVMRNQQKIDQYADVYSFGVIIWELLSEKIPFDGLTQQQITGLVGYDNDYQFQQPNGPEFLKRIMWKCLNRTPSQRPSFIQIQNIFDQEYIPLQKNPSP